MALALRLFLLLLLAVALPARAAQAAPLQGWQADLDHALQDLEVQVNDTVNVLVNARAELVGEGDLASKTTSRTEPLGDGEDVSAGRTFPVPVMIPTQKPGSRRRGPPRGKNKATEQKKPHEPSEQMKEMLKEMQQAGQEADGEAMQKEAFPGGSSGPLTAASAGREAMPGTATGDEVAQKASPLDWLRKVLKPLEPPSDVSAGRTFPAPLLIPTESPGSNCWGPLRGKNKAPGHKKPHESSNILKRIVTELLKGNVMGQKAGQKEVFPQGSRGRLAAPAAGRKAKPNTGMGMGTGSEVPPLDRSCKTVAAPHTQTAGAAPPAVRRAWAALSRVLRRRLQNSHRQGNLLFSWRSH